MLQPKQTTYEKALKLAAKAHAGKLYGSEPYINHLIRVSEGVAPFSDNDDLRIVAVLHDVVEDTKVTLEQLKRCFGYWVAKNVDILTRRQGEEYFDYIMRVSSSLVATVVKLADLEDNLKNNPPPSLQRRYERAARFLAEVANATA